MRGIDAMQIRARPGYITSFVYAHPGRERDVLRRISRSIGWADEPPQGKRVCVVGYRDGPPRCEDLSSMHAGVRTQYGWFDNFGLMEEHAATQLGDSGGAIIGSRASDNTGYGVYHGFEAAGTGTPAIPRSIFTPLPTILVRFGSNLVVS